MLRHLVRTGFCLAAAGVGILWIPGSVQAKTDESGRPGAYQVYDYNNGLDAWDEAYRKDPQDRPAQLDRAERKLEAAAAGRARFPEALLALGQIRFARHNLTGALKALNEAAGLQPGYVRAEALTYAGVIHIYFHRWPEAQAAFGSAMDEKSAEYTAWMGPKARAVLAERYAARREILDCVARLGYALALYNATGAAGGKTQQGTNLKALLEQIDRILPAETLTHCNAAVSGVDAGLWRFMPPAGEWRYELNDARPPDVSPASPGDLLRSLRIWAAAELGTALPAPLPPLAELSDVDRANVVAAQVRRAWSLQQSGDTAGALKAWEEAGVHPAYALPARQNRIYLLLRPAPGARTVSAPNLETARQLIQGPGALTDPQAYLQQLAYASALWQAAPASGPMRQGAVNAVAAQYRLVLSGIPSAGPRRASAEERARAEIVLGHLATETNNPNDVAHWSRALTECPPAAGRQQLRFYLATREALAAVNNKMAQQAEAAAARAVAIAEGKEPGSATPLPAGVLAEFNRALAARIFELNDADSYRSGAILTRTSYTGEHRAHLAAGVYDRAAKMPDQRELLQQVLGLLRQAEQESKLNPALQAKLAGEIKAVAEYDMALAQFPPALVAAWTAAADRTRKAMTPADWDGSVQAWQEVVRRAIGRPADERREAALLVVGSLLRKADAQAMEGDKEGARTSLRAARAQLSTMPEAVGAHLPEADRVRIEEHITANGKSLNAGVTPFPAASAAVAPYRGGAISPPLSQCVIIRYRQPIVPNVDRWLSELKTHPNALRRLVDWFNNGPLARRDPLAKRDFSADPRSSTYLVAYLEENISRVPGPLPQGMLQWCDHDGKRPWHGTPIRARGAAYYLKNGVPLVNAACSNPLNAIRVTVTRGRWTNHTVAVRELPKTVAPVVEHAAPGKGSLPAFRASYPVYAYNQVPVTPQVTRPVATVLVGTANLMPRLSLPRCVLPGPEPVVDIADSRSRRR